MHQLDTPSYPNQPDLALAALLYMLTRAAGTQSIGLNDAIAQHLDLVARDPRHSASLRKAAAQLSGEWACKALREARATAH